MGEKPQDDQESKHNVSRRDFLKGIVATGAAFGGGIGVNRIRSVDFSLNYVQEQLVDDIYTGYSLVDGDFLSTLEIEFLSRPEANDVDLDVLAYTYPDGERIANSKLKLHIQPEDLPGAYSNSSIQVDADVIDHDLVRQAEAAGEVTDPDGQGLYSWRDGGRMYNLVSGTNYGDQVANLNTIMEPEIDGLDIRDPVVFAFTATRDGNRHLLRQTPPIDPEDRKIVDGTIDVPTDPRHDPFATPREAGKFNRVSREGRHVMWYIWEYDGDEYGVVYPVHKLAYARVKTRETRYSSTAYDAAINSPYVRMLGRAMYRMGESKSALHSDKVAFELARTFCQTIPYKKDIKTHDQLHYPNFSEETLVEGTGDCEDKAVLLAGILEQEPFDYDTALIFPPKHVAVGVAAEDLPVDIDAEDVTNAAVEVNGTRYVYVESTQTKEAGDSRYDLDSTRAVYDGSWHRFNPVNNGEGIIRYLREVFGRD